MSTDEIILNIGCTVAIRRIITVANVIIELI